MEGTKQYEIGNKLLIIIIIIIDLKASFALVVLLLSDCANKWFCALSKIINVEFQAWLLSHLAHLFPSSCHPVFLIPPHNRNHNPPSFSIVPPRNHNPCFPTNNKHCSPPFLWSNQKLTNAIVSTWFISDWKYSGHHWVQWAQLVIVTIVIATGYRGHCWLSWAPPLVIVGTTAGYRGPTVTQAIGGCHCHCLRHTCANPASIIEPKIWARHPPDGLSIAWGPIKPIAVRFCE